MTEMGEMYKGPVIDVDVHHTWTNDAEVIDYLPAKWQQYYEPVRGRRCSVQNHALQYLRPDNSSVRLDAVQADADTRASRPAGEGVGVSDYRLLRDQLLDRYGIDRAVLTFDVGFQSGYYNPELAS